MKIKDPVCLFFQDTSIPTEEELSSMKALRNKGLAVRPRNSRAVASEGAVESCDCIAGSIPDLYKCRFPGASAFLNARDESEKAKPGDRAPAPPKAENPAKTGQKSEAKPKASAPAAWKPNA